MKTIEYTLPGGATLTGLLRTPSESMPGYLARPAVLVLPGGGYHNVSSREADPPALQFAAAGYHVFLLNYSVCEKAQNWQALRDAEAALALIRAHAGAWGVLPQKLAVCGFSAGGHLALSTAVLSLPEKPEGQQRPNAVILAYPVVTAGKYAHRGSFVWLTGSDDPAVHAEFGLETKIRPGLPPVFVWHCLPDDTVPVENSLLLVNALQAAHVPYEAHIFTRGGHGGSLCTAEVNCDQPHQAGWMPLAVDWLNDIFEFRC